MTTVLSWVITIGLLTFIVYEVYGLVKKIKEKIAKSKNKEEEKNEKEDK